MTTTFVIAAALIFICGLFAAIVERTNERDEARHLLARERREHKAEANTLAATVLTAADDINRLRAERDALDQENMQLHDAVTEAQIAAGTVRIPSLHVVRNTEVLPVADDVTPIHDKALIEAWIDDVRGWGDEQ